MVYRIAGVYRRRIDEILPYLPQAEIREEVDDYFVCLNAAEPQGASAEIRTTPAGFYVHAWTSHPAIDLDLNISGMQPEDIRNVTFANIGRWSDELTTLEAYADINRKTGDLTVGRYHLIPFAADPRLSVEMIREELEGILAFRQRVEDLLRERLTEEATKRASAAAKTSSVADPSER